MTQGRTAGIIRHSLAHADGRLKRDGRPEGYSLWIIRLAVRPLRSYLWTFNGFSLSSFLLCSLSFLWIGAQFPQEKFLSYGRILTLHYYFLLMCILLSYSLFFLLFILLDAS